MTQNKKQNKADVKITDAARLAEYRNKNKKNPAANLIGRQLNPSHTCLGTTARIQAEFKQNELYIRSLQHELAKVLSKKNAEKLKNGGHAHAGNICNPQQGLGDTFKPESEKLKTTSGDGKLYDGLLQYKNNLILQ